MFKLIFVLVLSLCFSSSFSQSTQVLKSADIKFSQPGKDFAFIEPGTDTSQMVFVATIEAKDADAGIYKLYLDILFDAQNYGANAFKLSSFTSNDNEKKLVLETFFLNDSMLNVNFNNHERNVVFIFGNEKIKEFRDYAFRINGKKKVINSDEFYKQVIKKDKEIKVSNGGFTGGHMIIKWRPQRDAIFLTLTGFGISGYALPLAGGVIFHAGSLKPINNDFGFLLTKVFNQLQ